MKHSYLIILGLFLMCNLFYTCSEQKIAQGTPIPLTEEQKLILSYKTEIKNWPRPNIDTGVDWQEMASIERNFSYYDDLEKPINQLGYILFFDPKLSGSNQISCSSCHHPETGWTTHTEKAVGHNHQTGTRNAPSIFNVAYRQTFFWDGRATSLEEQAIAPITAHNEMNMILDSLPGKLSQYKTYRDLFKKTFSSSEITTHQILSALSSFEKTVKSMPGKVDKFINGNYDALNNQEIRGLHLFRTKARCMNCHYGKFLTDQKFHNIGLTYYKREYEDLGRYNITKKPEDVGRFLTPSLRELLNTRPWMHNGLFDDLDGILNMYNSGMHLIDPTPEEKATDPLYPVTDSLLQPLNLSGEEINDLVAFLEALNSTKFKMSRPEIPWD